MVFLILLEMPYGDTMQSNSGFFSAINHKLHEFAILGKFDISLFFKCQYLLISCKVIIIVLCNNSDSDDSDNSESDERLKPISD